MNEVGPTLIDKPTYQQDVYPLGPFRSPPFEMLDRLTEDVSSSRCDSRDENMTVEHGLVWLLGALDAHGVAVREYDREVALVIAEEGLTLVQVVAGWLARVGELGRS